MKVPETPLHALVFDSGYGIIPEIFLDIVSTRCSYEIHSRIIWMLFFCKSNQVLKSSTIPVIDIFAGPGGEVAKFSPAICL